MLVRTYSRKTCSNISVMVLLRENNNCVNGDGVIDEDLLYGRAVNPCHCQIVIQRSRTTDTEQKFRLGSLNVGTMKGQAGEAVETLTGKKVDVCCVQEVRWRGCIR